MAINIKKSHEGLLHKNLGVKKDKPIPASKLKIKSTDSPAVKKRKQFALNAKKWHHGDDGLSIPPLAQIQPISDYNPEMVSSTDYIDPNIKPLEYTGSQAKKKNPFDVRDNIIGGLALLDTILPTHPVDNTPIRQTTYNQNPYGTGSQALYDNGGKIGEIPKMVNSTGYINPVLPKPVMNPTRRMNAPSTTAQPVTPQKRALTKEYLDKFSNFADSSDTTAINKYLSNQGLQGAERLLDPVINDQQPGNDVTSRRQDWIGAETARAISNARQLGIPPEAFLANKETIFKKDGRYGDVVLNNEDFKRMYPNYMSVVNNIYRDRYNKYPAPEDTPSSNSTASAYDDGGAIDSFFNNYNNDIKYIEGEEYDLSLQEINDLKKKGYNIQQL